MLLAITGKLKNQYISADIHRLCKIITKALGFSDALEDYLKIFMYTFT